MKKFVAVSKGNSGIFCLGIYDNYYAAFGKIMESIYEFKEPYKDPGDEFTISDPYETNGVGGIAVEVTYKMGHWDEPRTEYYYVLFCDD